MSARKFRAWDVNRKVMQFDREFVISLSGDVLFNPFHGGVSKCDANCRDQIVMQFTGLLDKNGREIFEGDIVKVRCANGYKNNRIIIGQVIYNEQHACFEIRFDIKENSHGVDFLDNLCEVIGNIYENPELETKEEKR